jgi:hypothetical protein
MNIAQECVRKTFIVRHTQKTRQLKIRSLLLKIPKIKNETENLNIGYDQEQFTSLSASRSLT